MLKVTNVEGTPNPNALKFFVDQPLLAGGTRQIDDADAAKGDVLAESLFALGGVLSVFYTGQFVTVTKTDDAPWKAVQSGVIGAIEAVEPGKLPLGPAESAGKVDGGDDFSERVNQVIDENVRPALEGDGGGIDVLSVDGYVVTIHYQGACGTCPSATQGTMMAVQNLLRAMVDQRIQVISA